MPAGTHVCSPEGRTEKPWELCLLPTNRTHFIRTLLWNDVNVKILIENLQF